MTAERQRNGRFAPGNCANPVGRPRKDRSVNAVILREMTAPVTVTENQQRKRISKLAANAKQVANQGASGDVRAAKMAIDMALRAERDRESIAVAPVLSVSDREIAARFVARLRLTITEDDSDAAAHD
jgi:replication-associated recombination protein RarA